MINSLDFFQVVVIITDRDGRIQFLNRRGMNLFGLSAVQIQSGLSIFDLCAPESHQQLQRDFENLIENGSVIEGEYIVAKANSETLSMLLQAEIERVSGGVDRIVGEFVVLSRDVQAHRQVEDKLKEHCEEEIKLRQALEREVQRRAEFTRALVHELKTPLTPMLATSELMVSNITQEPWSRMARNINRSAHQLNNRIEALLDLARGEMGTLNISPAPIDIVAMLRDLINEMAPESFVYEQSLSLNVPETLPRIMADESRLRQVLMNLINNAYKFSSANGSVTVSAEQGTGEIIFCVRDTGPGVSKQDQKQLFEAYHSQEGEREHFSGLGLGLTLAKTIVELHKGRIWVTSEKGKGSVFAFSIPITPVIENEAAIKESPEKSH